MTTTSSPPREGLLLPAFELPRAGGGTVRARAYRGRRGLVLLFLHAPGCEACRTYLTSALDHYAAYAEEGAEVIAILPADLSAGEALRHELGLPFPVACDADQHVFGRYGLAAGTDAAVMVTDRYGEPRIWARAGPAHDLPAHEEAVAELRYLALTCSGGCSVPIWPD